MYVCDTAKSMKKACQTGDLGQVKDVLQRKIKGHLFDGAITACKHNQYQILSMLLPHLSTEEVSKLTNRVGLSANVYTILDLCLLDDPLVSAFVQTYQENPQHPMLSHLFQNLIQDGTSRDLCNFLPTENKFITGEFKTFTKRKFVRACKRRDHRAIHTFIPMIPAMEEEFDPDSDSEDADGLAGIEIILYAEDPELVDRYIDCVSWRMLDFVSTSESVPFVQSVLKRSPDATFYSQKTIPDNFELICVRLFKLNDSEIDKLLFMYIRPAWKPVVFRAAVFANRLDIVKDFCTHHYGDMIDEYDDKKPQGDVKDQGDGSSRGKKRKLSSSLEPSPRARFGWGTLKKTYHDKLATLAARACQRSYDILKYIQTEFKIAPSLGLRWKSISCDCETVTKDDVNIHLIRDLASTGHTECIDSILRRMPSEHSKVVDICTEVAISSLAIRRFDMVRGILPFITPTRRFIEPHFTSYAYYPEMIQLLFPFMIIPIPRSLLTNSRTFYMRLTPSGPSVPMTGKQVYEQCILKHGIDPGIVPFMEEHRWVRSLYTDNLVVHLLLPLSEIIVDFLDSSVVSEDTQDTAKDKRELP